MQIPRTWRKRHPSGDVSAYKKKRRPASICTRPSLTMTLFPLLLAVSWLCPSSVLAAGPMNVSGVECGLSSLSPSLKLQKIVGGVPVESPAELPFAAALESPRGQQLCGATIVDDRWLVTAAHCIGSRKPESIAVVAGSLDPSASSDELRQETVASGLWIYPGYPGGTTWDVALIRLKKPLKWRKGSVQPACLPPQKANKVRDGQLGIVAGWGWNDEEGLSMSKRLHRVQVPLVSGPECEDRFRKAGYDLKVDQSLICAGWVEGGKDSCQGDSGGPLVVQQDGLMILTGVVSGGIGCARPGLPGLYTNVQHFLPWILETMKKQS